MHRWLLLVGWLWLGLCSVQAQSSDAAPSLTVITPDNVGQLEYLGLVGHGSRDEHVWSPDIQTLAVVNRLRGVWLYDSSELPQYPDAPDATPQDFIPARFGEYLGLVQFSPDSRLLLIGSVGGKSSHVGLHLEVWDTVTHKRLWQQYEAEAWLPSQKGVSAWSADGYWVAYTALFADQTQINLIDSKTGKQQWQMVLPGQHYIEHLQFSSDGTQLVIGEKGRAQLVDVASQVVQQEWISDDNIFLASAFSANGEWLALREPSLLRLYNLHTHAEYTVPQIPKSQIDYSNSFQLVFSPDSRWLAVSNAGLTSDLNQPFFGLGIWNMPAQQWHQTFPGTGPLAFTEKGLAFTEKMQTYTTRQLPLMFWYEATGSVEPLPCSYTSSPELAHFVRQNCPVSRLAYYYQDFHQTDITFGPARTGYALLVDEPYGTLAFDPSHLESANFEVNDFFHHRRATGTFVTTDGQYVLTRLYQVDCYCPNGGWEIREVSGEQRWGYTGDMYRFGGFEANTVTASLAISPDHQLVASGHANGVIRLWDVPDVLQQIYTPFDSGHELGILQAHSVSQGNGNKLDQVMVTGVAFEPDGNLVSVARHDAEIRFWEMPSGRSLGSISTSFLHGFDMMTLSLDGRWLATGEGVWDLSTQTLVYTLPHAEKVVFTPDSHLLLISDQHQMSILDRATGKVLFRTPTEYPSALGYPVYMAVSPDGKVIVTVANGVIRAWGVRS